MVLFSRAQHFPPPAVHPEGRAAINERCFHLWIVFQSSSKEVNLISYRIQGGSCARLRKAQLTFRDLHTQQTPEFE